MSEEKKKKKTSKAAWGCLTIIILLIVFIYFMYDALLSTKFKENSRKLIEGSPERYLSTTNLAFPQDAKIIHISTKKWGPNFSSDLIFLVTDLDKPVWMSLIMKNKDTLLDGTSILETLKLIDNYNIKLLLINCNNIDSTIKISNNIQNIRKLDFGLYPNLGIEEYNNSFNKIIDESNLKRYMESLLNLKPSVIGLCCGSNPSHIKLLKSLIRECK